MSADRLTELLSWGILAAGLALAATMLYVSVGRFDEAYTLFLNLPVSPR